MKHLILFILFLSLNCSYGDFSSVSLFAANYAFSLSPNYKELKENSSVYVNPGALLRQPASFSEKINENEKAADVINRIIPKIKDSIGPNQLAVVIAKENSIEKRYIGSPKKNGVTDQQIGGITLSPGDVIILSLR